MNSGDLVRIVVAGDRPGGRWVGTLGFRVDVNGATQADLLSDLNTHQDGNAQTVLQQFVYGMVPAYTLDYVEATDVKPGTAATVSLTPGSALTGAETASGDALPPQSACRVNFYTATKGRSYRGGIALPGGGEGDQNAGVWSSGHIGNVSRLFAHLFSRYGPAHSNTNFTWVVLSQYANRARRAAAVGTPVIAWTVNPSVKSQRRRSR